VRRCSPMLDALQASRWRPQITPATLTKIPL
jgi:hypothetical protein